MNGPFLVVVTLPDSIVNAYFHITRHGAEKRKAKIRHVLRTMPDVKITIYDLPSILLRAESMATQEIAALETMMVGQT